MAEVNWDDISPTNQIFRKNGTSSPSGYAMNFTHTSLDTLRRQREGLIIYLRDKTDANDWHGVADAAMDLREIDVAISIRERRENSPNH